MATGTCSTWSGHASVMKLDAACSDSLYLWWCDLRSDQVRCGAKTLAPNGSAWVKAAVDRHAPGQLRMVHSRWDGTAPLRQRRQMQRLLPRLLVLVCKSSMAHSADQVCRNGRALVLHRRIT